MARAASSIALGRRIMASGLRDDWKKFKSKYPEFEKSKSFKSDLGPNLDDFAKAAESARKNLKNAQDDVNDMIKASKNIENISKSYGPVVESIKGTSPGAVKDWNKLQKDLDAVVKGVSNIAGWISNMSLMALSDDV
jgi:hypothetical protein